MEPTPVVVTTLSRPRRRAGGAAPTVRLLGPMLALVGALAAAELPPDAEIAADWLDQERLRLQTSGGATTAEDAAGAVDGVKDGSWGFHTNLQDDPWWQVDLGESVALARVVVYNRADGAASRAASLRLLLSDDGREWRELYRHDGTVFYGATDGKPLAVPATGHAARFVRALFPGNAYLHLDEVEVYAAADPERNIALGQPADQCGVSQWSKRHAAPGREVFDVAAAVARGRRLADELAGRGVDVRSARADIEAAAALGETREAFLRVRGAIRALALANPLLDFDTLLFVKRAPGSFTHMSDQHYGWWSRPGGGVCLLTGFRDGRPRVRCLTDSFPPGTFASPELSPDGTKVLFAYCRYYPESAGQPDKQTKSNLPEDAFYHLFEMPLDGGPATQLTAGRYDDFDGRYLPGGEIVFLSTRRGTLLRTGDSAMTTLASLLPDSYVRCGGDPHRPVAVYTLHRLSADRSTIRCLSPFENFEWTPSVGPDGRILYARWDYVDRSNMPYISLWSTNPDGSNPQTVYGNHTLNPHCIFEARPIPGSRKLIFTASGHHSITGGSLVLLDPARGLDGPEPMTRLTPEVCFPETEGWPQSYYLSPYPLDETFYLCAWSNQALGAQGALNPVNACGLYLYDAFGNLELLYRDPAISSQNPLPVRAARPILPRPMPTPETDEGRLLLLDVYEGLRDIPRGSIHRLRVVGVPAKVQPNMNTPNLGLTNDDPGKVVLGTVPVEADGSAYLRLPAGLGVFLQALDERGRAVQTMRGLTYVQAGQTLSCGGCHEPRNRAPVNRRPQAVGREPSRLTRGPDGSWPLRFDTLVQPLLDRRCVSCHRPDGSAAGFDLTQGAYERLVAWGSPSLREHVGQRYAQGFSVAGAGAAQVSALARLLEAGHHDVGLDADDWDRLYTWMDTYAQRLGSYSTEQERELTDLRLRLAGLLDEPRR